MTDPSFDDARKTLRGSKLLGVGIIVLGLLAMGAPLASGLAVATMMGILLLLAGVIQLVFAFRAPTLKEGLVVFLFGGIAVLAGVFMVARPQSGLSVITMVLTVYFLVDGAGTIVTGWRLRPESGSGWMIFGGVTTFLLGILLLAKWPLSGHWAVGVLLGVRLVVRGFSMIALSAVGRQAILNEEDEDS